MDIRLSQSQGGILSTHRSITPKAVRWVKPLNGKGQWAALQLFLAIFFDPTDRVCWHPIRSSKEPATLPCLLPLFDFLDLVPLNEIPKHIGPQTRSLIEAAQEDAWQELNKDGNLETKPARSKLRTTIVALASVGETDHRKLKWFAIHAWKGALQAEQSAQRVRASGSAA
jgi:hypothetical protein